VAEDVAALEDVGKLGAPQFLVRVHVFEVKTQPSVVEVSRILTMKLESSLKFVRNLNNFMSVIVRIETNNAEYYLSL
jgi:hypothetical protein